MKREKKFGHDFYSVKRKKLGYAYYSSPIAERFNGGRGCWYVATGSVEIFPTGKRQPGVTVEIFPDTNTDREYIPGARSAALAAFEAIDLPYRKSESFDRETFNR